MGSFCQPAQEPRPSLSSLVYGGAPGAEIRVFALSRITKAQTNRPFATPARATLNRVATLGLSPRVILLVSK